MLIEYFPQYSDEWFAARLGRITLSNAKALLTRGRGVTRRNYLLDVASEIISGKPVERFQNDDMLRGLELESYAIAAYEALEKTTVNRVGLVWRDHTKRICGSLDGIASDGLLAQEVKCPRPRAHMRWIADPSGNGHTEQMQAYMWISGAQAFDFISFCPDFAELPLFVYRVERDEDMIERIEDAVDSALIEIDAFVAMIRRHSASQDKSAYADIYESAREHMRAIFSDGEIEVYE